MLGTLIMLCHSAQDQMAGYVLLQVHYDRNAAQRTNVIDDQSDYFEIDSNAWLTDQVGLVAVCGLACQGAQCVGGLWASELPGKALGQEAS